MEQIIFALVQLVVVVIAFFFGKYIQPKLLNTEMIAALSEWVYKFVVSAKNQFVDASGAEKREYVTKLVLELCKKYHIELTEDQIRALIEEAYETMKAGEQEVK